MSVNSFHSNSFAYFVRAVIVFAMAAGFSCASDLECGPGTQREGNLCMPDSPRDGEEQDSLQEEMDDGIPEDTATDAHEEIPLDEGADDSAPDPDAGTDDLPPDHEPPPCELGEVVHLQDTLIQDEIHTASGIGIAWNHADSQVGVMFPDGTAHYHSRFARLDHNGAVLSENVIDTGCRQHSLIFTGELYIALCPAGGEMLFTSFSTSGDVVSGPRRVSEEAAEVRQWGQYTPAVMWGGSEVAAAWTENMGLENAALRIAWLSVAGDIIDSHTVTTDYFTTHSLAVIGESIAVLTGDVTSGTSMLNLSLIMAGPDHGILPAVELDGEWNQANNGPWTRIVGMDDSIGAVLDLETWTGELLPRLRFGALASDGTWHYQPSEVDEGLTTGGGSVQSDLAWTGEEVGIVWAVAKPGFNYQIYLVRVRPDDGSVISSSMVSESPAKADMPRLIWMGDGYGVTWVERKFDLGNEQIMFRKITCSG